MIDDGPFDHRRDAMAPVTVVGNATLDGAGAPATQEQCQSSCSCGNGGCQPSKTQEMPLRRNVSSGARCRDMSAWPAELPPRRNVSTAGS